MRVTAIKTITVQNLTSLRMSVEMISYYGTQASTQAGLSQMPKNKSNLKAIRTRNL